MQVDLCPVSEIAAEGSTPVEFFGRKVHVVLGQGGVPAAFMDVCTHLGGPLVFEAGRFQCQWHSAVFDGESGRCLSGPALESRLLRLPTKVEGGVLKYVYGDDAEAQAHGGA